MLGGEKAERGAERCRPISGGWGQGAQGWTWFGGAQHQNKVHWVQTGAQEFHLKEFQCCEGGSTLSLLLRGGKSPSLERRKPTWMPGCSILHAFISVRSGECCTDGWGRGLSPRAPMDPGSSSDQSIYLIHLFLTGLFLSYCFVGFFFFLVLFLHISLNPLVFPH